MVHSCTCVDGVLHLQVTGVHVRECTTPTCECDTPTRECDMPTLKPCQYTLRMCTSVPCPLGEWEICLHGLVL